MASYEDLLTGAYKEIVYYELEIKKLREMIAITTKELHRRQEDYENAVKRKDYILKRMKKEMQS